MASPHFPAGEHDASASGMIKGVMFKNTDAVPQHPVRFGFWPNGHSENLTLSAINHLMKTPGRMRHKTTVNELKLLANLNSAAHPERSPLNLSTGCGSADDRPACIDESTQNSKPW